MLPESPDQALDVVADAVRVTAIAAMAEETERLLAYPLVLGCDMEIPFSLMLIAPAALPVPVMNKVALVHYESLHWS